MKALLTSLTALVLAATVAIGTAGANGSVFSPGLAHGWPGVGVRDAGVRYVAFGMPKSTIVAVVRARDGRVLRSRVLSRSYGVPLVAYDGTTGGLSGDGRSLVLATYAPLPGDAGRTRFVVLESGTLKTRRSIVLPGSWSYDAISPDASTLFLTEHLRAGDKPLYRVRTVDARSGELRGTLVDRLEGEGQMGGVPVARASSADGRWAYTLYARRDAVPFVHALDTARRQAYCVGIPVEVSYDDQWSLRVQLRAGGRILAVKRGRESMATLDTRSWKVSVSRS